MPATKQISTNQEVFAGFYDEFMPKVYRYIHYKVNDVHITEDLTSTVMEKALVGFDRYRKDRAAFSTWVFSIARNTLIDYYRTDKARRQVSLDEAIEVPSRETSPQEEAEHNAERECLRGCMARLPEGDQEIIRLKFAGELNNRQIAEMLRLSESNIGVRLFRAIRKLREDFNESWNG
jgi:RNA polymerase sigma factor (sigma-70 family)